MRVIERTKTQWVVNSRSLINGKYRCEQSRMKFMWFVVIKKLLEIENYAVGMLRVSQAVWGKKRIDCY